MWHGGGKGGEGRKEAWTDSKMFSKHNSTIGATTVVKCPKLAFSKKMFCAGCVQKSTYSCRWCSLFHQRYKMTFQPSTLSYLLQRGTLVLRTWDFPDVTGKFQHCTIWRCMRNNFPYSPPISTPLKSVHCSNT
jgi:hypothetical protein